MTRIGTVGTIRKNRKCWRPRHASVYNDQPELAEQHGTTAGYRQVSGAGSILRGNLDANDWLLQLGAIQTMNVYEGRSIQDTGEV